jgi:hypothetical protein
MQYIRMIWMKNAKSFVVLKRHGSVVSSGKNGRLPYENVENR